jgi:hypothetical protein
MCRLLLIATVEWTSDEAAAVYDAFCTLDKEDQLLSLQLAVVSSKYAAKNVHNRDLDQQHEDAEEGEFNSCFFVALL